MVVVIGIALLVAFVLAVFDPYKGLLGLLAVAIIQPGELYPIFDTLHVERILTLLVLVSLFLHGKKLVFPKMTRRVLGFWLAMFLSIPFSWWISGTLSFTQEFGKTVLFHLFIVALVDSEQRFKWFVTEFALLLGWLAASSVWGYYHGAYTFAMGIERASGLTSSGSDPNSLGLTLVSGLPIMLLLLFKGKGKARWMGLATAGIAVCCVLLTASRTSFFGLLFLGLCFVLSRKKNLLLLPVLVILLAGIWTILPQEYQQRYLSVENRKTDESYTNRLLAWEAGWMMFKDQPITGVGAGQFSYANGAKYWPDKRHPIWLQPHSLYIQLMAELGILGIIAFAAFLTTLVRTNMELSRRLRSMSNVSALTRGFPLACTLSVCVLLFAGYSGHNLYRKTWYILAAMTGALALQLERKPDRQPDASSNEPGPTQAILEPAGSFSAGSHPLSASGLLSHYTNEQVSGFVHGNKPRLRHLDRDLMGGREMVEIPWVKLTQPEAQAKEEGVGVNNDCSALRFENAGDLRHQQTGVTNVLPRRRANYALKVVGWEGNVSSRPTYPVNCKADKRGIRFQIHNPLQRNACRYGGEHGPVRGPHIQHRDAWRNVLGHDGRSHTHPPRKQPRVLSAKHIGFSRISDHSCFRQGGGVLYNSIPRRCPLEIALALKGSNICIPLQYPPAASWKLAMNTNGE